MKLYIWGTGRLVGKVVGRYIAIDEVEAFIDNDKGKNEYMGKKVIRPEQLIGLEYDAVLVANLYGKEIRKQCLEIGIKLERVIFLYNNCTMEDINQDYTFVNKILGEEYAEIVKRRYHIIRGVEAYGELCLKGQSILGGGIKKTIMSGSNVLN